MIAPFSGKVIRSDSPNEIIMLECGELPPKTEVVITNVEPEVDILHPDDPAYDEKRVCMRSIIKPLYNIINMYHNINIIF